MNSASFSTWLKAYGDAWQSGDADEIGSLFSAQAEYYVTPFAEPWRGRRAIVAAWQSGREGHSEVRYNFEALTLMGDRGLAHVQVTYLTNAFPLDQVEADAIFSVVFDESERCREFRQWMVLKERPEETDPDQSLGV